MGQIISLGPNKDIWFLCRGTPLDHQDRFIKALVDVWSNWIPGEDRRRIYAHYSNRMTGKVPQVDLLPPEQAQWCMAHANAYGTMFRANSMVAFILPGGEEWLKLIIVHELAHCLLFATGDPSHGEQGMQERGAWHAGAESAAHAALVDWKIDTSAYSAIIGWIAEDAKARGFRRAD